MIVSEFMYLPWKFTLEQAAMRASMREGNLCTPSITAGAAETFDSCVSEYLREQVRSEFSCQRLSGFFMGISMNCIKMEANV